MVTNPLNTFHHDTLLMAYTIQITLLIWVTSIINDKFFGNNYEYK